MIRTNARRPSRPFRRIPCFLYASINGGAFIAHARKLHRRTNTQQQNTVNTKAPLGTHLGSWGFIWPHPHHHPYLHLHSHRHRHPHHHHHRRRRRRRRRLHRRLCSITLSIAISPSPSPSPSTTPPSPASSSHVVYAPVSTCFGFFDQSIYPFRWFTVGPIGGCRWLKI